MSRIIGWIALGASLIFVLWLIGADHSRTMELCQRNYSESTCIGMLR